MKNDMVIVVNSDDKVIDAANKYVTHQWTNLRDPINMLHRAFSVFLFNSKNELLLQQRVCHMTRSVARA